MNAKPLSLAGTIAAAIAAAPLTAASGAPAGQESCYGVSMKGQNDCATGAHSCAGQATADYSGADFKYVPAGSCVKMNAGGHKGTLAPA